MTVPADGLVRAEIDEHSNISRPALAAQGRAAAGVARNLPEITETTTFDHVQRRANQKR